MNKTTSELISDLLELHSGLVKRANTCADLATQSKELSESKRLMSKSNAYWHSAELLSSVLASTKLGKW